MENPIGLKLSFYENEGGQVIAHFTPGEEHQGYPGVLHGGITATLLDEAAGRVVTSLGLWMVTAKLEIRYRKPIPIGKPLTVIGEAIRLQGRSLQARSEIRLEDGTVAADATSLCLKLPDETVEQLQKEIDFWRVIPD